MNTNTTSSTLRESLGLLSDELADFAIDSDDDDDVAAGDELEDVDMNVKADDELQAEVDTSITASDTATATATAAPTPTNNRNNHSSNNGSISGTTFTSTQLKKETVSAKDDPLSSSFLTNSNHNSNTNTNSYTNNATSSIPPAMEQSQSTVSTSSSSVTQTLSSKFSSFASKFQDAVNNVAGNANHSFTNNNSYSNSTAATSATGNFHHHQNYSGGFSTTNYTNLNQNIVNNNNPTSTNTSTVYNMNINNNMNDATTATATASTNNSNGSRIGQHGHQPQTIYQAGIATASGSSMMNTNNTRNHIASLTIPASSSTSVNNNGPSSTVVKAIPDLDHAMKSALITSALDQLLPGEKVIVFLSHLIQVRDSSTPQTGLGLNTFHTTNAAIPNHHKNDLIWCCVVTFYRLVVFSYHESDFNINQSITTSGTIDNQQNIINETKNWIQSASVSRQYQHIHTTRHFHQQNKRHDVLQMPLASVDRIEKSTDFGIHHTNNNYPNSIVTTAGNMNNSSVAVTTSSLFSSAAASFISNATSGVGSVGNNSSSYPSMNNSSSTSSLIGGGVNDSSIRGSVASGTLVVYGKDNGRFIQFTTASYADCMRIYESLNTYAFPGRRNLGYLFAFESRRAEVMASTTSTNGNDESNGVMKIQARVIPKRYDALAEFNRMTCGPNASTNTKIQCPWAPITRANASYTLCASYPSILFGPNNVDDSKPEGIQLLRNTAAFRSGGRFQTLSWASRFDGASIWRSAQPKVGLQGNRSHFDETYMKRIAECAALANSQAAVNGLMPPRPSVAFLKMLTGCINESDLMLENFEKKDSAAFNEKCMLKIFDMRPLRSAMANKTQGYGYENTSNYKNTTISFFGIGNIHAVRDSYNKISALCASPAANDVQWMQLVEDTKWLSFVRLILSASWQAAFHVRYNRIPVLIHCSHGWDRTSQVCALSQIFLDPYTRTRAGFSCLIEKDFLALGHPFHTRCGHGEGKGGDANGSGSSSGQNDEMSPIFLQFLDCVFQIVNQYPDYFEFNTKYLLLISEHIYSCRFGNLLCDTEREREVVASIRQRTYCLWEYLDSCPELVNTNYSHSFILSDTEVIEGKGCLLMPLPSLLRNVTLWVDRFCMHGAKPTLRSIPVSNDETIAKDFVNQPLHGLNDFANTSIQAAVNEAAKWKEIAEQREKEIISLQMQVQELKSHQNTAP